MKQVDTHPEETTTHQELQDKQELQETTQEENSSHDVSDDNVLHTTLKGGSVRKYPQGMSIRPRSYWQELAELGALYDFLQLNMANEFANDLQFRKDMMCIMIDYSSALPPEVELELLRDLESVLTTYINTVKSCNSNHQ
jgi:hypothetical protein